MALLNIASFTNVPSFSSIREHVAKLVARRHAYTQAYNELSALSDRDLADIGIHRDGIPQIARMAARDSN